MNSKTLPMKILGIFSLTLLSLSLYVTMAPQSAGACKCATPKVYLGLQEVTLISQGSESDDAEALLAVEESSWPEAFSMEYTSSDSAHISAYFDGEYTSISLEEQ